MLPWTELAQALVAEPVQHESVQAAERVDRSVAAVAGPVVEQVAAVPLRSGLEEKTQGCSSVILGQTLGYWPVRDWDQAATDLAAQRLEAGLFVAAQVVSAAAPMAVC